MADLKKASAKSKVEAVLFSVGHKITVDEICKLCRSRKEEVLEALQELRAEYDSKQSSLMLIEDGDSWKFAVRDHLISVVRKIVTETELTRSVMETLAVIAFKYPILQADLIKMRTNKAYDHLAELEKSGYISRQKNGRTNLIKLTEKFFRYFDLTEEKLKDQFKDFDSIARAIKEKEVEVDKIREDQLKKAQDLKQEDEKIRSEIESLDKADEEFSIPVEAYNVNQKESKSEFQGEANDNETKELIGDLEVVNVGKETKKIKEEPEEEQKVEIKKEENANTEKNLIQTNEIPKLENINPNNLEINNHTGKKSGPSQKKKKHEHHGIKLPPESESKVNERVSEIMRGEESKEDAKEENQNQ